MKFFVELDIWSLPLFGKEVVPRYVWWE